MTQIKVINIRAVSSLFFAFFVKTTFFIFLSFIFCKLEHSQNHDQGSPVVRLLQSLAFKKESNLLFPHISHSATPETKIQFSAREFLVVVVLTAVVLSFLVVSHE